MIRTVVMGGYAWKGHDYDHNVSGTITIENETGDGKVTATITAVDDLLAGTALGLTAVDGEPM